MKAFTMFQMLAYYCEVMILLNQRVLNMLQTLSPLEVKQEKNHQYLEDMPQQAISKQLSQIKKFKVLNNYFFRNRDVYISKHNRFAPYPTHTHTFLEMNYMLTGHAEQLVNDKKVVLHQGDLLLLDVGTRHSIGMLSQNDLLINILFRNSNININFLNDLRRSRSVLYDFLLKSAVKKNDESQKYLIFRTANNKEISQILDNIIEEYFLKKEFSDTMIKAYLQLLITSLVRNYHDVTEHHEKSKTKKLVIAMLNEIDEKYASITLEKLAKKYCYNRNYLSNLFKKEVGKSFSEIVLQKRLIQAHTLIVSTTLPISKIIEKIGISNKTYFYKKYYEFYKEKPTTCRQQENQLI